MKISVGSALCRVSLLLSLTSLPAATVYDGGAPDGSDGGRISSYVHAQQFTLGSGVTLQGLIFFGSANINDVQSQFGGTIGFRLMADNAGTPGASLAVGSDSSVQLVNNGTQNLGTDEYRFLVNLGSIPLAAGTYWLALHEGAMGAAFDGSEIYWDTTSSAPGGTPNSLATLNLTGLTSYSSSTTGRPLSFQLLDTPAYSAVPEPSTWALMLGAGGALLSRRRR